MHPLIFKIVLYDNRRYQEEISNLSSGDLAAITALQRKQTVEWYVSWATSILWKYFENNTLKTNVPEFQVSKWTIIW